MSARSTSIRSVLAATLSALSLGWMSARADVDPAIKSCSVLRKDLERLACYDRTVAQLSGDASATQPLTAQDMFGMETRVAATGETQAPVREEIRSIEAKIKLLRQAADGRPIIELDNGQIWKQEDSKNLLLEIGDPVTISRAAMSSFKLAVPGKRFARVRRLE
jgi:hypothetical protein